MHEEWVTEVDVPRGSSCIGDRTFSRDTEVLGQIEKLDDILSSPRVARIGGTSRCDPTRHPRWSILFSDIGEEEQHEECPAP